MFSEEQQIWIIFKYGEVKSHCMVRRAFRLQYPDINPKCIPQIYAFKRVYEKFKGGGDIFDPKPVKKDELRVPQDNVDSIEAYFL